MHNPFLIGETVYLRAIEETDLNAHYREWLNDEEVCKYNSHHRFPNYDENMHEYYERVIKPRKDLILAVSDKKTDTHIGNVALENIDSLNQNAEFAIILGDKSYWGRGVGKEAMRLIISHGFNTLNLNRIYCGTAEDNLGMQNLAQSLGFKEEGRLRQVLFKGGAFKDMLQYGLLRNEFNG